MSQLVDLVQHWELFKQEQPSGGKEDFATWLLRQVPDTGSVGVPSSEKVFRGDSDNFDTYGGGQKTSLQGAYLIAKLGQYINYYTKPMMRRHGLHSLDDFGYLQNIRFFEHITKTKACELMLQEITTGVDIINRLIKNGFIQETINELDKRQKLLTLTQKGNQVLEDMTADLLQLPDTLGELSANDRSVLLQWLMQLDAYHDGVVKEMGKK